MRADEEMTPSPVDVTVDSGPIAPGPHGESWLPMALDFGPLMVWFLSYRLARMWVPTGDLIQAIMISTGAFMVAIVIAVLASRWRLGRVSPMLWLSATLVVFFGGLTILFRDKDFIQTKPTVIYAFFALMLLGGWVRGKPLLRFLLQSAYSGLDETGWLKLSRNWGLFFAALGVANEIMRHILSFDMWLTLKVWGVTAASLVFAMANVPMLLRHGLSLTDKPAPSGK